ncbi:hypothetical protein NE398_07800 [Clostridium tertium]|uniref:YjcQ protein n=1 Tax=Clostridium tertium TaxID=1559 RepID=A0A9X4AZW6_9CLOT|nr:hypothetical protein [Clostridium tertium]MDC4240065.1 hypothetical protein [Clostridium tertium]
MENEKVELMILEQLDFGMNILIHANYNKFGLSGKDEFLEILRIMKEKGWINYREETHELFKGEPNGKIIITKLGKTYLNENK